MKKSTRCLSLVALAVGGIAPAHAISVTANTDADQLAAALTAGGSGGLSVVSATLSGHSTQEGAASSGTYTNASNTYLIGGGIVISSGDVNDYSDGPNINSGNTTNYNSLATAAQQTLLFGISGQSSHYDVTELDIVFTTDTGEVFFNVVFGSDEYAEYVGSQYIDAFGLYVDGTNIAFYNGFYVNVDHPDMDFRTGTELDGVLPGSGAPMLFSVSGLSTTGTHTLKFIIADSGDAVLDSTAYISALGGFTPPPPSVPEPGSLALLSLGLLGLGAVRRRRST